MKSFTLILLLLGTVVFSIFSYLQLNDLDQYGNGDAWFWVIIYLIAAALNLVLIFLKLPTAILYSWLGFTLGSLCFRLQDGHGNFHFERLDPATFWNPATAEMVQQSNESGGLLILFVWAGVLIILNKVKH